MADTLNTFFEKAVTSLGIPQIDHLLTDFSNINDPIEKIIKSFQNILKINQTIRKGTFNFHNSDLNEIQTEILNLKSNVACVHLAAFHLLCLKII